MKDHPDDHLAEIFDEFGALDKIGWMIETNGWALEASGPQPDTDPPTPAYAYTIGLTALTGFSEIAVFGLAPAAANGLIGLAVDALRGGTQIPYVTELIGLFDNDLRSFFAPVDLAQYGYVFTTAAAWYKGEPFAMTQLLYPDRNGFMPYETGYDQRMRFAQPVIGRLSGA